MKNKKIITAKTREAVAEIKNHLAWFNITLLALTAGLTLYYVVVANNIAAKNYKLSVLQNELSALQEENGALSAKKVSIENISYLADFARNNNMVEARNAAHIFERGSVALRSGLR